MENTSNEEEVSFTEEATMTNEQSENDEAANNDLSEFGVDSQDPDLFNNDSKSLLILMNCYHLKMKIKKMILRYLHF